MTACSCLVPVSLVLLTLGLGHQLATTMRAPWSSCHFFWSLAGERQAKASQSPAHCLSRPALATLLSRVHTSQPPSLPSSPVCMDFPGKCTHPSHRLSLLHLSAQTSLGSAHMPATVSPFFICLHGLPWEDLSHSCWVCTTPLLHTHLGERPGGVCSSTNTGQAGGR